MAERSLSAPTLIINNDIIAYVPNSLTHKMGHGEITQRVATTGGEAVKFVISEDVSTKIGTVKFSLYNTQSSIDLINNWKIMSKTGDVAITVNQDAISADYSEMVMINDPDLDTGFDSEIEIEMHGRGVAQ